MSLSALRSFCNEQSQNRWRTIPIDLVTCRHGNSMIHCGTISKQSSLIDLINMPICCVLLVCGAALIAATSTAEAQSGSQGSVPKIAVFSSTPPPPADQGLREGLSELGLVEGKTINIDWRRSLGSEEELRSAAAEAARDHALLIVSFWTPAARAALQVTALPVVFVAGDPVAAGLASNLAQPDRATGVSMLNSELISKRMQLLRELLPASRRAFFLMNPSNPLDVRMLSDAQKAAKKVSLEVIALNAHNSAELESAIQVLSRDRGNGLLVSNDLLFLTNKARITQAVRQIKHVAIFPFKEYHDDGAFISYGPNARAAAHRVASYVAKILRGATPSQLPIEQISQQELVIDLRVARESGIHVPQDLLLRADEILR
jgi:ABC-type uncharacterized transport system substrate-binding protein